MSKNKKAKTQEVSENEVVNEQVVEEQTEKETDKSTVEEVTSSADEVAKLKEEVKTEKDKFLRLFAEFENYKKRTSKERVELFKTAGQDIMTALLPVIDDFDRCLVELNKQENKELTEGVVLIKDKFVAVLDQKGLKPMQVKAGDEFNADIHEAITQIPAPEEKLKGKIIDVVEKGYQLGDKIVRFPKVVIGQ